MSISSGAAKLPTVVFAAEIVLGLPADDKPMTGILRQAKNIIGEDASHDRAIDFRHAFDLSIINLVIAAKLIGENRSQSKVRMIQHIGGKLVSEQLDVALLPLECVAEEWGDAEGVVV